jgi:hypothetical protein
MALFLLLCMPLTGLFLGALGVSGRIRGDDATARDLGWQFLAGGLAGLPCQAILLLVSPLLVGSFRPGPLYVSSLFGDHILPLLLAVLCYVAIHVAPVFGRRPESLASFSQTGLFLAGYFAILAVADYVGARRELTGHALFLVPLARVATIIVYARILPRAVGSSGWQKAFPIAALVAWPFLAAFEGLWARQGHSAAASLVSVGLALLIGATWSLKGIRLRGAE